MSYAKRCSSSIDLAAAGTAHTSLEGKTVVLTGAGGSIGSAAAHEFAARGAKVVPIDRTQEEVATVASSLGVPGLWADASRFADVRRLADELLARYERIDVLALNAGCLTPARVITEDGNERTIQVNHLSPFLLTALLRDRLAQTPGARIVVTASLGSFYGGIDVDDLNAPHEHYSGARAYCRSKLANVLFTHELARRLDGTGTTAACFHPGWIASGLLHDTRVLDLVLRSPIRHVMRSPQGGAAPLVALATVTDVSATNGIYFSRFKQGRVNRQGRDRSLAVDLWDRSGALVGVDPK
jgi:NAD(P)-dependent dehydrogenase (short-subunit alcohol dehydrogenase family)